MTETFEVGQKVKHASFSEAEVTYGPFTNSFGQTRYIIRLESGRETYTRPDDLSAIPEPPKFAVGDKVVHWSFGPGEIAFGPFQHYHGPGHYLMKDEEGNHVLSAPDALTKAPTAEPIKVGDRIRIVRAKYASRTHGREGVVTSTSETWLAEDGDKHPYRVRLDDGDRVLVAELERIDSTPADTYEHDGVTYDLSARYRDRDGDVWKFERIGDDVYGDFGVGAYPTEGGRTLASAARHYGPLTRVND